MWIAARICVARTLAVSAATVSTLACDNQAGQLQPIEPATRLSAGPARGTGDVSPGFKYAAIHCPGERATLLAAGLGVGYEREAVVGAARDLGVALPCILEAARKLCDKDEADCDALAAVYETGIGATVDKARAKKIRQETAVARFQRGCTNGATEDCISLGYAYDKGAGIAKDSARAATLFLRACEAGSGAGCSNICVMYALGRGVTKNPTAAVGYCRKSCEQGILSGCSDLGVMSYLGVGTPKDVAKAAELFRKACEAKIQSGCVNLAELHSRGVGVPKDDERARALLADACNEREPYGCAGLGAMDELGLGGPARRTSQSAAGFSRAVEILPSIATDSKESCDDYSDSRSCTLAGVFYNRGIGTSADAALGTQLLKKGCSMNDAWACAFLREAASRTR